MSKTPATTHIF